MKFQPRGAFGSYVGFGAFIIILIGGWLFYKKFNTSIDNSMETGEIESEKVRKQNTKSTISEMEKQKLALSLELSKPISFYQALADRVYHDLKEANEFLTLNKIPIVGMAIINTNAFILNGSYYITHKLKSKHPLPKPGRICEIIIHRIKYNNLATAY